MGPPGSSLNDEFGLPLYPADPGLLCPEIWSGDLFFHKYVGDTLLPLDLKLLLGFMTEQIGIVALSGPCFTKFGDDLGNLAELFGPDMLRKNWRIKTLLFLHKNVTFLHENYAHSDVYKVAITIFIN